MSANSGAGNSKKNNGFNKVVDDLKKLGSLLDQLKNILGGKGGTNSKGGQNATPAAVEPPTFVSASAAPSPAAASSAAPTPVATPNQPNSPAIIPVANIKNASSNAASVPPGTATQSGINAASAATSAAISATNAAINSPTASNVSKANSAAAGAVAAVNSAAAGNAGSVVSAAAVDGANARNPPPAIKVPKNAPSSTRSLTVNRSPQAANNKKGSQSAGRRTRRRSNKKRKAYRR
jgi:hypothetical protein